MTKKLKLKVKQVALTRWFKYDRDDLCVKKSQFVPVIFEPPCIYHGALKGKAFPLQAWKALEIPEG